MHQGVVDEVRHHLVQGLTGHPHGQLGRHVDAHVRRGRRGVGQGRQHLVDDLGEVRDGVLLRTGRGRGRQHVLQQPRQPVGVVDGRVEHVVELRRRHPVPSTFDRQQGPADAGQGRPELVRDRGDKVTADAVGLLKPGHQALLTLVELGPVVLGPATGLLVEMPEDHLRGCQRTDERRADRGECPGRLGRVVGEDPVPYRAVRPEHERDGQQVDRPVLIEGYQRHHHEEVEVHLGLSV